MLSMQSFSQQPTSTQPSRQQQRQRQRHRCTLSTFVTTFNLNGALPSSADVQNWLGRSNETSVSRTTDAGDDHDTSSASVDDAGTATANAADADLVIISLQECPTKPPSSGTCTTPSRMDAIEPLVLSMGISGGTVVNTKVDHGGNENVDTMYDDDSAFVEAIQSALSADHGLVADISMGVDPGTATPFSTSTSASCSDDSGVTKAPVKWYGYIRLLVYARDAALIDDLRRTCFPILIPVGTKLRVLDQEQSISVSDEALDSVDDLIINTQLSLSKRLQYYQLGSPDKGAVCLALPTLGTMVVASHLAGTNEYGVPEVRFDRIRHKQLESISNALEYALTNAGRCVGDKRDMANWAKIIAGDLNFRVEVHNGKDDKRRGGRDWRVVADIVQSSDGIDSDTCTKQQVIDLFCNHDRLQNYLDRGPLCLDEEEGDDAKAISHRLPSVLTDMVDLIHLKCAFNGQKESAEESAWNDVIFPTFPFRTSSASSSATCSTTIDDSEPKSSNLPCRRFYTDKRTPSWTDRILVSRDFFENEMKDAGQEYVLIRSCPNIFMSDHIPVKSYLNLTYDRD